MGRGLSILRLIILKGSGSGIQHLCRCYPSEKSPVPIYRTAVSVNSEFTAYEPKDTPFRKPHRWINSHSRTPMTHQRLYVSPIIIPLHTEMIRDFVIFSLAPSPIGFASTTCETLEREQASGAVDRQLCAKVRVSANSADKR
jgi:hypothetical protein